MTHLRSIALLAVVTITLLPAPSAAADFSKLATAAVSDATARRAPAVRTASDLPPRDHSRHATKIGGAPLPGALYGPVMEDDHLVLSNGFDNRDGSCDPRGWSFDDRSDDVFAHVSDRFVVNRPFLNAKDEAAGAPFPTTFPADASTSNLRALRTITRDGAGDLVFLAGDFTTMNAYRDELGTGQIHSFGPGPIGALGVADPEWDPSESRILLGTADGIWAYPPGGGTPTRIAGNPSGPAIDGPALNVKIDVLDIAVDNAGNVYWAEQQRHVICMLRKSDMQVVTIAGTGAIGSGGDGGPATAAQFNYPSETAVDPTGTYLYVLDQVGVSIRRINLSTNVITFYSPTAGEGARNLTVSGSDVYVTINSVNMEIFRATGTGLVAVAGGGDYSTIYDVSGGAADPLTTNLGYVHDMTPDGSGGLYFTDSSLRLIFHLPAGFATLERVAGTATGAIAMGERALWFGADATSAPQEVANWVQPYGFGDGWSQRFTSPAFDVTAHPNAVLRFEGTLTMYELDSNASLFVRGQKPDGSWVILNHRRVEGEAFTNPLTDGSRLQLSGWFKLEVHLGEDGNELLGLASSTRVQVVVQTRNQASMEDGIIAAAPGAAIIDNVSLRDGATDVLPAVNFEDGSTGGWTLSALNGAYVGPALASDFFERDGAPNSIIDLRTSYDFSDDDCVWTFASAGDTVSQNVWARLSSPWIPRLSPTGVLIIEFSGKLNTAAQRRVLDVIVLGKNAGAERPHVLARPLFLLNGGVSGGDLAAAYLTDQELLYPLDYSSVVGMDSVKVLFQIEGRREALPQIDVAGLQPTKLPYLDDIELFELGADAGDWDGVADIYDACPTEFAAGEDADENGCISPTASMRHIESWSLGSLPIRFQLAENGDPDLPGNIELTQIRQAFAAWDAVPEANLSFVEGPTVASGNADAMDGINLVTFEDDYDFPANVIAITTTTSFTRTKGFWDDVAIPGQIVDADIIFNTHFTFDIGSGPVPAGAKDLRSIATHEIGHLLGLSHSGVAKSTMYPILLPSRDAASIENDDREAVSAAFPTAALTSGFGTLRGSVNKGTDNAPVAGALVMAMHLAAGGAPDDTVASDFTREDGTYAIYRLPAGDYAVRIVPLDGSVPGLLPRAVNERVEASAFASFAAEFYGGPESNSDDPTVITPLAVTAGATVTANLITNIDVTAPTVVSVAPAAGEDSVRIQSPVVIRFSEPVSAGSLASAFKLRILGETGTLGGLGNLVPPGDVFVFSPATPLAFGQTYEIVVGTELTDRDGNALAAPFTSTFLSETQPSVAILDIQPRSAPEGAFITITGVGIDPNDVQVQFAGATAGEHEHPNSATPTQVVIQVPGYAIDGPIRLVADTHDDSNDFDFDVITGGTFQVPNQLGDPIALEFAPTDVAMSPEGSTVLAAGANEIAVINLSATRPNFRDPQYTSLTGARRVAMTPDGRRALVTVPSAGKVTIVDTDTSSATFGLVRGEVTGLVSPDGIAIDQSAQRAWVSEQGGTRIFELNIDPLAAGYPTTTRTINTGFALNGGVTLASQQLYVFATSASGIVQVRLSDGVSSIFDGGINFVCPATTNAIEGNPAGDRLVACGYGAASGQFLSIEGGVYSGGPTSSMNLLLGGTVRDVLIEPFGSKALIANSALDQVQIVDIAGNTLVGQAITPATPVALALNADGSLLAVATSGDPGITLYSTSNSTNIVNIAPAAGRPGDQVVMRVVAPTFAPQRFQGASNAAGSGSGGRAPVGALLQGNVIVGGATTPVTYSQLFTTAFTVPDLAQQQTSATYDGASSTSSSVSFTVVDPIETFQLREVTGEGVTTAGRGCPGFPSASPNVTALAISPNGRYLAVGGLGNCGSTVDIYDISATGANGFGQYIGSTTPFYSILTGLAFSAGSDNIYMTSSDLIDDAGSLKRYRFGASPDSSQLFGQGINAMAVDPVGELLAVLRSNGNIQFFDANLSNLGGQAAIDARSLAWTRDGHYLVVGRQGAISLIDRGPLTFAGTTTPVRAGSGFTMKLGLTTDGRRVYGLTSTGAVLAWSLETATLTNEVLFIASPGIASPSSVVPAPDGNGVLVGSSIDNSILKFDPGPTTILPTVGASQFLATSPDGRQLWVANNTVQTARAHTMSLASHMALVSGDGLSVQTETELPVPVTVHLTDAGGAPQVGVLVRFTIPNTDGHLEGGIAIAALHTIERLTDASGEASVHWTMPETPRACEMTVEAPGVAAPLTVHVNATGDASVAPPLVVGLGPVEGATGIRSDGSMYVRFSQRMNPGSVAGGLQVLVVAGPVNGVTEREDDYTFRFNPTNPLPFGAACTFRVNAGILDAEGQSLAATAETHFTIEPERTLSLELITPPAAPNGASIVLSGNGFSTVPAQNSVLVGGRLAPVATATATALVVTVPENAVSGDVTVRVGSNTSNPLAFVVLDPDAGVGGVLGDIPSGPGIRDIAVTSDGARTYVTNPQANSVAALDVQNATTLAVIPVGLTPQAIAILPGDRRAYVANTGSDNVSVLDIDPGSLAYHSSIPGSPGVVRPIPVGDQPIELAVAAFTQKLIVVNGGDSTISIIDTDPTSPAADQVVSGIKLGGGGTDVAVEPDGQLAYIATELGVEIVDIEAGAVRASIPIAGGGTDIAIEPDGALLFVLTGNDSLYVIDITPGSATENQVVASLPVGGGGTDVDVQPDGTHVYVTIGDGDRILVFEIVAADESGASIVPGPIVRLVPAGTIDVGDGPAAMAFSPVTGLLLVANEGDGTITLIGPPTALDEVEFAMDFSPDKINLKSGGRYVQACIGPLDPYTPGDVAPASILLNGVVPASRVFVPDDHHNAGHLQASPVEVATGHGHWWHRGGHGHDDGDDDDDSDGGGCGDNRICAKFSRAATILTLGDEDTAPVVVTGLIGTRRFVARDTIRVKRGKVHHPHHADHVTAGSPFTILYDRKSTNSSRVALVHSVNDGRTWTICATNLNNNGAASWTPPMVMTDSARVAIVEIEEDFGDDVVTGVVGVSERFSISGTTSVQGLLPVALELSSPYPNPGSGQVRFSFGLPARSRALVEVFDVRGRRVKTLLDAEREAGWHDLSWNGRDASDGRAGAGLYFVRLRVGGRELQRRVIWLE